MSNPPNPGHRWQRVDGHLRDVLTVPCPVSRPGADPEPPSAEEMRAATRRADAAEDKRRSVGPPALADGDRVRCLVERFGVAPGVGVVAGRDPLVSGPPMWRVKREGVAGFLLYAAEEMEPIDVAPLIRVSSDLLLTTEEWDAAFAACEIARMAGSLDAAHTLAICVLSGCRGRREEIARGEGLGADHGRSTSGQAAPAQGQGDREGTPPEESTCDR